MHLTRNAVDGRLHYGELKQLAKSPYRYLYACNVTREPWTEEIRIGAVADALIYGGREVRVYRGVASNADGEALAEAEAKAAANGEGRRKRTTPRNGAAWESFSAEARAVGAITCIESEYTKALGCVEAIQNPKTDGAKFAADLLAQCSRRQTVHHWTMQGFDCATGIHSGRGGIDAWEPGRILLDTKITGDVEPQALQWHAQRMHWHGQLGWYQSALLADGYSVCPHKYLVCFERTEPHDITVLEIDDDVIEAGMRQIYLWLGRLRACESSGKFGGYADRPVKMVLADWGEE